MVSTVRERDFSRNFGDEEGTEEVREVKCGVGRGYRKGVLGGGWWLILRPFLIN